MEKIAQNVVTQAILDHAKETEKKLVSVSQDRIVANRSRLEVRWCVFVHNTNTINARG